MKIDIWLLIKNTLWVLWEIWPLWILLIFVAVIRIIFDRIGFEIDNWRIHRKFKKGEEWRSDRDLLRWVRGMQPKEFEEYMADLFSRMGYKTKTVGGAYDGGIDVIAEKDGIVNYIQCKKFITSQVGVGDIRDFYGALADQLANSKGYFITTNKFTLESQRFAEDKPIELVDGFDLIRYIRMTGKDSSVDTVTKTEVGERSCPQCGGSLIKRSGKFGKFFGCSNYPKCKYTTE